MSADLFQSVYDPTGSTNQRANPPELIMTTRPRSVSWKDETRTVNGYKDVSCHPPPNVAYSCESNTQGQSNWLLMMRHLDSELFDDQMIEGLKRRTRVWLCRMKILWVSVLTDKVLLKMEKVNQKKAKRKKLRKQKWKLKAEEELVRDCKHGRERFIAEETAEEWVMEGEKKREGKSRSDRRRKAQHRSKRCCGGFWVKNKKNPSIISLFPPLLLFLFLSFSILHPGDVFPTPRILSFFSLRDLFQFKIIDTDYPGPCHIDFWDLLLADSLAEVPGPRVPELAVIC